jgi:hypothetical protein
MSDDVISSPHAHIIPIPRTFITTNINMVQSIDSAKFERLLSFVRLVGKYGSFSSFYFLHVTLSSAGAIRHEYSPDDGVQWVRVKPWTPFIERCTRYCISISSAVEMGRTEVHSFVVDSFTINLTLAY